MANGMGPVAEFERARKNLNDYFGCGSDFFVKLLPEYEWAIRQEEEFVFLTYWTETGRKVEAVVVKQSGEPMVYKTRKYTMVVAIDCVKIGFIFRNEKNRANKK